MADAETVETDDGVDSLPTEAEEESPSTEEAVTEPDSYTALTDGEKEMVDLHREGWTREATLAEIQDGRNLKKLQEEKMFAERKKEAAAKPEQPNDEGDDEYISRAQARKLAEEQAEEIVNRRFEAANIEGRKEQAVAALGLTDPVLTQAARTFAETIEDPARGVTFEQGLQAYVQSLNKHGAGAEQSKAKQEIQRTAAVRAAGAGSATGASAGPPAKVEEGITDEDIFSSEYIEATKEAFANA